jgi:drug/metabolite transporter (DMT)-like permease
MAVSDSQTPVVRSDNRVLEGIGWMVLTGLCFVVVTGIVRNLGSNLPAVESAFIRYLIGLIIVGPVIFKIFRKPPSIKMTAGFAIRGLVHGMGVIFWFYAMARIPIAEVTAIGYTSPIFVTIGAALFLGEKMHIRRVMGILVGLVGAFIILRPGFQEVSIGQLAQLIAAPLFAISFLIAKRLTDYAEPDVIVAWLTIFCTLVLLPGAVMNWQTPTTNEILWLALTAFFATLGHYTFTKALQAAPISVTQPISFLQLVWAALLGVLVFGEPLDIYVMLGGGVIVAAATYISHREAKAARMQITPLANGTKF